MRAELRNALDKRHDAWTRYLQLERDSRQPGFVRSQAHNEERSRLLDEVEHVSQQIERYQEEERAERLANGVDPDSVCGTAPRPEDDGFGRRYIVDGGLSREAGWGRALRSDESFEALVRGTERQATPELSLRKYLRGMVTGDWDGATAERRAMAEGVLGTGGYMLPAPLSAQIIDLARNQTRVLQAGAGLVPMPNKTLDMARWEQDPTATWHTENALIPASDATLGRVRLDAKALTTRVVASRELLEDAPGIENELRNAFARQFALTVDYAALYGAGVDPEPRGVKNTAGITTINYGGANGGVPISYGSVIDAIGALEDVNETPRGIIWSPRTGRTFARLTDSTGQPIQMPDVVANLPRYATAQVPNNLTLGTSTDTSDAFVADWSKLLVGVRTGLQIQVLTERYSDAGQIGFLAWWRGDIAVARPKAFCVLKGIRA